MNTARYQTLLEDLKDFYVWKVYTSDPDFVNKWIDNRDEALKNIPRSKLYT